MRSNIILFLILCAAFFKQDEVYSQGSVIVYYNWDNSCDFKTKPNRFIINNEAEFKELSMCKISSIDLESYTIIGIQGSSPGHFSPAVGLVIFKDDIEKKYVFKVDISGGVACDNACRVNRPFYQKIVYTDKLEPEYRIEYLYNILKSR